MIKEEIISGGVYAKGEVAREEAEERQRKREASAIWRKNKQEKEQREKAERLARREKKRLDAWEKLELKNAPLYAHIDRQEYKQLLTQYFETYPLAISALPDRRPTTDELLQGVLGLTPKLCGQRVRMAFGKIMRELGFEQVQGTRIVKLSDEQKLRRSKRRHALIEDLRGQIRDSRELTIKQKRLIIMGPPENEQEKCSYWRRPFTKYVKAPNLNKPAKPTKPVYKSGANPKIPKKTVTVPHPIVEVFPLQDTKDAIAEYLKNNPQLVKDGFNFKDLTDVRPPIPNLSVEVNSLTFEELVTELGYIKTLRTTGKVGNYWGLPKPKLALHQPQAIGFGKYEEPDEEDLFLADPKYKDFDTLDDDDDLTGPDTKGVHAKSTSAAPDALDDYYDELDDDLDEDFA